MTMQEVAKRAGVSVMTVSRVVNGFPRVAADTKEKVRSAISEVGYVPANGKCKFAPYGKTGDVGLVLIGTTLEYLKLPLHSTIISNIEKELSEKGFRLILIQVPDVNRLPESLDSSRLDGALVIGGRFVPRALRPRLKQLNSVMILGSYGRNQHKDCWVDWIGTDYYASGRLAAEYLVKRGHLRIAYLNPMPSHPGFQEVALGFEDYARTKEAEVLQLIDGPDKDIRKWDRQKGKAVIESLVERFLSVPREKRPTGMHIANDEVCSEVYPILAQKGVGIGRDVEIISRGNEGPFLSALHPRPATIDLNPEAIAHSAVSNLMYRMSQQKEAAFAQTIIAPRVVAGETEWLGALG